MSDPNYFALTCLLGIAFGNAIRAHRIVQLILALGVLISGSRAGILVLFIFIALNALTHTPPKKRAALAIIGIGLAATLTPLLKSHLPESISMLFNPASYSQDADRNSLQDRVVAISAALTAFGENPIFGYGLGNLVLHPQNTHQQVSHNSYIELLAETGLAGFFFYCALCFYLTNSTRHPKALGALRLSESTSRRSAIVAFLFFSAMSLTLVTYYSRIFFFSMAIVFLLTKRSANE